MADSTRPVAAKNIIENPSIAAKNIKNPKT
jgi:hypothetical protein